MFFRSNIFPLNILKNIEKIHRKKLSKISIEYSLSWFFKHNSFFPGFAVGRLHALTIFLNGVLPYLSQISHEAYRWMMNGCRALVFSCSYTLMFFLCNCFLWLYFDLKWFYVLLKNKMKIYRKHKSYLSCSKPVAIANFYKNVNCQVIFQYLIQGWKDRTMGN